MIVCERGGEGQAGRVLQDAADADLCVAQEHQQEQSMSVWEGVCERERWKARGGVCVCGDVWRSCLKRCQYQHISHRHAHTILSA